MGVEEQRVGEEEDQFPIGMRVLAVDDDPICLMLLETLLRRCQYKVTATSQAITALRMLRERKDDFDLVISDVNMPDMDGFKLLEHVGLEMDLPVIMLSAHSDPKLVMKGITHGACDYLLKPVRMEELQNIWQHVIRRKSDTKDRKSGDKARHGNDEGKPDHNLNKKRKDQMEDEEDDSDDNEAENEDPKTQKKARVVWSGELHGRFLAAVKQLGLDKAVPKRILDLMRVDNITRENVASHLQKFRLGLKKFNTVADQQALVDGSYLHTGSIDGSRLQNATLRGHPNRGMLRRLNSPTGLGVHDLPPLPSAQSNHIQAPGHLTNDQSYFHHNILHGMPISMGPDDETHHGAPQTRDLPRVAKSAITFPLSSGFSGEKIVAGSSNIRFLCGSNKPSPFEVHSQHNSRVDFPCRVDSRGCNTPETINYTPQLENYNIKSVSNAAGVRNSTSCWFPINQAGTHLAQSLNPNELLVRSGLSSAGQFNWTDRLAADARARPNNGCTSGQQCLQGNYDGNSGSLEDLVGAVVKQDRAW